MLGLILGLGTKILHLRGEVKKKKERVAWALVPSTWMHLLGASHVSGPVLYPYESEVFARSPQLWR